ncbi:hypothetical protein [Burkholderia cenocepacia]|uniref:hypothetical protein n=1 Tax=Burkholderia cenocepacia TaxID=95486 RepID=UPI001BA29148|nr:hypothetical protein [Burkholderia cenocepacia]MBR8426235.1 hypothetical protein [Burkholderia cenocepacia]
MKRVFLLSLLCAAASATAQSTDLPSIAGARPSQDLIVAACTQAVMREQTPLKRIDVRKVSIAKGKTDSIATCLISAAILEGSVAGSHSGTVTTNEVQYSVGVDLRTGDTTLARVDAGQAEKAARDALATMFIDLRPIALSPDTASYSAIIAGRKCKIDVAKERAVEPQQWLTKKIECAGGAAGRK